VTDESALLLPANAGMGEDGGQESFKEGQVRFKKVDKTLDKITSRKIVEVGSEEHERIWKRFERRVGTREARFKRLIRDLWKRQEDSILAQLRSIERIEGKRDLDPFDMKDWVKRFREAFRPILRKVVDEAGNESLEDLMLIVDFDIAAPAVIRAMEKQTQRFATHINETTWNDLRKTLAEGIDEGEGVDKLKARVKDTFMDYVGLDPAAGEKLSRLEMIARTEAVKASNAGQVEAWRQSGVVKGKAWLSALIPGRTRETHHQAHIQYQETPIGLDENFAVGAGSGPHPGAIGLPEEDINCLCTMTAVVSED